MMRVRGGFWFCGNTSHAMRKPEEEFQYVFFNRIIINIASNNCMRIEGQLSVICEYYINTYHFWCLS